MTDGLGSFPDRRRRKVLASSRGLASKGGLAPGELQRLDLREEWARRRLVCAGFCTFHKPEAAARQGDSRHGEAGDAGGIEHCGGLSELERLIAGALATPEVTARWRQVLTAVAESDAPVSYRWDAELEVRICLPCPYLPDGGCDHRNSDIPPEERLEPCGGYVLLAALADRGLIRLK